MRSSLQSAMAQQWVLRTYTALHVLRSDWRGSLILSLGLQAHGAVLPVAANIAGAVSLAVEPDPMQLREVVRTGACDFVVNTLDEAIRAMKNEVRRRSPLSVALSADVPAALAEIEERGLAPQLFASFIPRNPEIDRAISHLQSLGAILVDFQEGGASPDDFTSSESVVTPLLREKGWQLYNFAFDTPALLRTFDSKALSSLHEVDRLRRRWLEAASRILPRQHPPVRSVWLTEEECRSLAVEFPNATLSRENF
jgi:urocanate hydratase